MRVPFVRFGSNDRPLGPWEERLAPLVVPIVVPLLFGGAVLISAIGLALLLGWAALSPMLPRRWRFNWDTAFALDPSAHAECPACRSQLVLGAMGKRGHVLNLALQPFAVAAQTAVCSTCGCTFSRLPVGKVWSSWQERQPPRK
jgi:hypothetical protein